MKPLLSISCRGIFLALWVVCATKPAVSHAGDGVTAWGYYYDNGLVPEFYRPMFVPPGLTNVVSIAGGFNHALALAANGRVSAWGTYSPATNVPPGLSNVVCISAGGNVSLALKADGTVVGWGWTGDGVEVIPAGLSNVVSLATGGFFGNNEIGVALKADTTVVTWGGGSIGPPPTPNGLSNVVAIATGGNATILALKDDGTVVAWGNGPTNVPVGLNDVVEIAVGSQHCLALRAGGTVVGWGSGLAADVPAGLSNVASISAGYYHSLALRKDGTVVAWGMGTNAVVTDTNTPWDYNKGQCVVPVGLTNVIALAGGGAFSLAVTNGVNPPTMAPITGMVKGTNGFRFSIPTQRGKVFSLEYKNSLADSQWSLISLTAGTGSTMTFTDPHPADSQRFYQVRRW